MVMSMSGSWMLRVAVLVIGIAPWFACSWGDPPRPATVPEGATPVAFSKEGGWAHCWLDRALNVNRCRVYNARGERLYQPGHEDDEDDVFVRDEGEGPVPEAELRIDRVLTSPGHIWLTNGVVLLPRNAFEVEKPLIDQMKTILREQNEGKKQPR